MALKFPDKDPNERLDYTVDWSRFLDDLTISTATWRIQKADGTEVAFPEGYVFENDAVSIAQESSVGLVCNAQAFTNTTATIVLNKGDANTTYKLICEIITTESNRTNSPLTTARKISIKVRERT
jgi:hypothetical protein